jgi:thiol-disulfide isomerase/thioredoxin
MSIGVVRLAVAPLAVLLSVVAGGCADRSSSSNQSGPAEAVTASSNRSGSAEAVTVRVVDETEFAAVLHRYRGKVVLVDVWATWCLNCLELFPHTVELSEQYADRGLVVVSLSMDDPDQRAAVLERLQSNGATFDNFISRYGGSDQSAEAFGLEDLILPKYRLYDRSGQIHNTLRSSEGPLSAEDVDRAVEELLGPG